MGGWNILRLESAREVHNKPQLAVGYSPNITSHLLEHFIAFTPPFKEEKSIYHPQMFTTSAPIQLGPLWIKQCPQQRPSQDAPRAHDTPFLPYLLRTIAKFPLPTSLALFYKLLYYLILWPKHLSRTHPFRGLQTPLPL